MIMKDVLKTLPEKVQAQVKDSLEKYENISGFSVGTFDQIRFVDLLYFFITLTDLYEDDTQELKNELDQLKLDMMENYKYVGAMPYDDIF